MPAFDRAWGGAASRRALIKCGLGLAAGPIASDPQDEAAALAARWSGLDREHHRLIRAWQHRETELFHDPVRLRAIQAAARICDPQLSAIDMRLDALQAEREALLPLIIRTAAQTRAG